MQNMSSESALLNEILGREKRLFELQHLLDDREQAAQALRVSLGDHEQAMQQLRESIAVQEESLNAIRVQSETPVEDAISPSKMAQNSTAYKLALALTLANSAYNPLFVLDVNCKIIAINNAAEELFGAHRPIGRAITELTEKPELEFLLEDVLTNRDEPLEEQMSFGKRIFLVRAQVIQRDDYTFIGLAMQDVTDLVRLNRARRDMVANISHELRTPIANIRLIIDSLFHEQDKPKRKQSTSALHAIARETDSLLWLVQELLDLSMIESGQAILRMLETSLFGIVNEAIERMEDQASAKDVTIISTVSSELQILADADQVRRVLLNLIHNAIKWSPQNGTITITADLRPEEVVVSVLDDGSGVPEDQTERIFERFYQVDQARSGGEGTGLGLAICKHIIGAHGGTIWAEGNQNGGGGIFRFTLALA